PADVRAAERRMAGEGHFIAGREDAHARIAAARGQDEGGFGQVELPREILHALAGERSTVLEDAQRITAYRRLILGEDIDDAERESGHPASISTRPHRSQFPKGMPLEPEGFSSGKGVRPPREPGPPTAGRSRRDDRDRAPRYSRSGPTYSKEST